MIVVGVDGSPASDPALVWAADEAARRGSPLRIVHVEFARPQLLALYPRLADSEHAVLAAAARRARDLQPGIDVTTTLAEPPAVPALIGAAAGAEMLVLGSRGLGPSGSVTVGSVALECAHRASSPVVIVRPGRHSAGEEPVFAAARG